MLHQTCLQISAPCEHAFNILVMRDSFFLLFCFCSLDKTFQLPPPPFRGNRLQLKVLVTSAQDCFRAAFSTRHRSNTMRYHFGDIVWYRMPCGIEVPRCVENHSYNLREVILSLTTWLIKTWMCGRKCYTHFCSCSPVARLLA